MKTVRTTGSYEKDFKRCRKRSKDMFKLAQIVKLLEMNESIPVRCRPHKLSGNWAGHWELHIEPDWLLIYQITHDAVYLYRIGTHADLFD